MLLLAGAMAGGCAHVPKVIVLEDPLSAEEHVALGVAYERKGELELASREYERALKKDGSSFQARVNLGNVRLAEKRYADARREYLEALDLRPGEPGATNNLAWAAILSGDDLEDALGRMEAVMANPAQRSPTLLDTLGVLLGKLSRDSDAEAAFAEGLRRCETAGSACPDGVRRELEEHAAALRGRRRGPADTPSLVQ
jgi:Flp pilus assembly protein TadD